MMYTLLTVIWVACEGKSEKAYLAELNRLFQESGVPIILKDEVAGGGSYARVTKAYKTAQKNSGTRKVGSHTPLTWIWVDSDLYERNEKDCDDLYKKRKSRIPDFLFSCHNFEDFLVLHLADEQVAQWINLCNGGTVPLHERDYLPLLPALFPDYQKPNLPAALSPLTPSLLSNAYRHSLNPAIPFRCDFIEKLVPLILTKQPDFFSSEL